MKPQPTNAPTNDPAALRRMAEARLAAQAATRPPQTEGDLRRLQHELEVHQIELEMQNEELRTARDEVQAVLERYTDLYDFAPVGYFSLSAEGKILAVNLTGAKLLELERARLVGQSLGALLCITSRPTFEHFLKEAFATKSRQWCKVELLKRDGSPATLLLDGGVSSDGQACRIAMSDVTEHKRRELSHARLAMAVEQSPESVLITDDQGTVIYVNPAFEKITGYTRAEVLGNNPRLLRSGKHDQSFYRQMWETLLRGEPWQGHLTNRSKDGRLLEMKTTISPVRDAAGRVVNYVSGQRDVTREMLLEEQLRQSQKMEAVGTLAGGVAHDFNNILAAIQMQTEMIRSGGGLSAEQNEFTCDIMAAVKRAADLTRQLLLFSRKQIVNLHDLELNESIVRMAKMLRRILGEHIDVRVEVSEPSLFVHADQGMLDQVLLNLAVNARDAMPKGGLLVIEAKGVVFDGSSLSQTEQARPGSFVSFSVRDTGCGIPPENLPRIFEPFFTTKDIGKGTGLGLATVFGIVQQHRGWINVRSEVGRGTSFEIYLPRVVGLPDKVILPKAAGTALPGRETILVVEDEDLLRGMIRITLERLGYRVLDASSGTKAMGVWQEHHDAIDLVLTDMRMPDGMTGTDLGQRLLSANPSLKVIYMSGYSADIMGENKRLKEGENFLAKPFDIQRLTQVIRANMEQGASTRTK
jgi:PAS domain S-box-containing protein